MNINGSRPFEDAGIRWRLPLPAPSFVEKVVTGFAVAARTQPRTGSHAADFSTCSSAVCAHTPNTELRRLAPAAFDEKVARLQFIELQGAICQQPSTRGPIR